MGPRMMDVSSFVPKKPKFGCCGHYEAEPLDGDTWAEPYRSAGGKWDGKVPLLGIPWALW